MQVSDTDLTTKLPRHVQRMVDRHGHVRHYWRKPGYPRTTIKGIPGSEEWFISLAKAISAPPRDIKSRTTSTAAPGSMARLIADYTESFEFRTRPESVQDPHKRALAKLAASQVGEEQAADFDRESVQAVLVKLIKTPSKANEWRAAIRDLFRWAIDKKRVSGANPVDGIAKRKGSEDGFHTWTESEVERYRRKHAIGTMARAALEVMYWETFRSSDAIRVGHDCIVSGHWDFVLHKNRKTKPVRRVGEVAPELIAVLSETQVPGGGTAWGRRDGGPFLRTTAGKPFGRGGFIKAFRKWCDDAGLRNCTSHGIRKRGGCDLAEGGATAAEIAAVLGHRSEDSARPYVKKAQARVLTANAGAKRRHRLASRPEVETVNPA